jgi:hypothetical protein
MQRQHPPRDGASEGDGQPDDDAHMREFYA